MDASEEDWLDELPDVPISAIEHFSYCPRQCALIHVEQTFDENLFTIRGRLAHERVDSTDSSSGRGVQVVRGIPLWSERLGLRGKADLVELRAAGPFPVEYKLGRPRGDHAKLQLCAQALCLEEMLETSVPRGALFYHEARRREEVEIDAALRARTVELVIAIRAMLRDQLLPPAPNDARCRNCSLLQACMPAAVAETPRLRGLQGALFRVWDDGAADEEEGCSSS